MFCLIKYTLQEPVLGTNMNRYHHQPYAGLWLAYEHSSASLFWTGDRAAVFGEHGN